MALEIVIPCTDIKRWGQAIGQCPDYQDGLCCTTHRCVPGVAYFTALEIADGVNPDEATSGLKEPGKILKLARTMLRESGRIMP